MAPGLARLQLRALQVSHTGSCTHWQLHALPVARTPPRSRPSPCIPQYQEFLATLKTQTVAESGDPYFEGASGEQGQRDGDGRAPQAVAEAQVVEAGRAGPANVMHSVSSKFKSLQVSASPQASSATLQQ